MNYGKVRGEWSDCTNEDFEHYYKRVEVNSGFCLEEEPNTRANCVWTEWTRWSSCSATCGGGSQSATRTVQATGGGMECSGQPMKSQRCGNSKCPVSCVWSDWSSWSSCSVSCGGGSQSATRTVMRQATNGGKECSGEPKKTQKCGESECPVHCVWSEWSTYSSCSVSCGGGSKFATRTVLQHSTNGGKECSGQPIKSQSCETSKCPDRKYIDYFILLYMLSVTWL